MTNAPERLDTVMIPPGMKRVYFMKDSMMSNAGTYKLMREGHTAGNLIRMELLRDSRVRFGGYMISHPLEHDVLVKVQTSKATYPHDAVIHACVRLEEDYKSLEDAFYKGLQTADVAGEGDGGVG